MPEDALRAILDAVEIRSAYDLSFFSEAIQTDIQPAEGLTPEAQLRLQQAIYSYGVMGWVPGREPPGSLLPDAAAFRSHVSAANQSVERWDRGWVVLERLASGQVLAEKGGLIRLLHPGEYATFAAWGSGVSTGSRVSCYCPRESSVPGQAFYFAFGETPGDFQDDEYLARFYWNVQSNWAAPFVRAVTGRLNPFRIPFRMKCLAEPKAYPRRDAAVLYVPRSLARTVAMLLMQAYPNLAPGLGPDTPLMTRPLAPGLAFAEDPGNGESFGMHRARLIAEAISLAHAAGDPDRLTHLERHFARNGLDLSRPHLGPGPYRSDDVPSIVPEQTLVRG